VAARRAFGKAGVKIAQFGSLDDARAAMSDYFRSNSFFVTYLELVDNSVNLMQQLKRRNPRLPVVVIDDEADLRRRHDLLRRGADLYLTKPSPARLQPGMAEEELSLFADELVLFAERAFKQWEQVTGGFGAEDPTAPAQIARHKVMAATEANLSPVAGFPIDLILSLAWYKL